MHNHAPANYICPFCLALAGIENEHVLTKQSDLIYRDADICAFIAAGGWPNNKGHVLIIPNAHFENLYDLPDPLLCRIHCFSRQVALALKEVYRCDGVTIRQHNEPAGDQDVCTTMCMCSPAMPAMTCTTQKGRLPRLRSGPYMRSSCGTISSQSELHFGIQAQPLKSYVFLNIPSCIFAHF